VHYTNAGTVEFIFDPAQSTFYFLEMNTRLQVEHPITELVTGLDLVQWQIRVAAGERFPYRQEQLNQHGHAIECRIYAEDPANHFLPSTGRLLTVIHPEGPGIRIDSGMAAGLEITHHYDPLLAKLIVHAEDRPAAIRRMLSALRQMVVHGVVTNIDFLQDVLTHTDFGDGKVTTRWVEAQFETWAPPAAPPLEALLAAALADFGLPAASPDRSDAQSASSDPFSPWQTGSGFRN
jgi:acetyl/propionyl-CoA carboxylase alpha subunit